MSDRMPGATNPYESDAEISDKRAFHWRRVHFSLFVLAFLATARALILTEQLFSATGDFERGQAVVEIGVGAISLLSAACLLLTAYLVSRDRPGTMTTVVMAIGTGLFALSILIL